MYFHETIAALIDNFPIWAKVVAFLVTWFLLGAAVGWCTHSATLGKGDE